MKAHSDASEVATSFVIMLRKSNLVLGKKDSFFSGLGLDDNVTCCIIWYIERLLTLSQVLWTL